MPLTSEDDRLYGLTYDWGLLRGAPPGKGDILVSYGAKGVGMVYLIDSVRLVKSKYRGRYALKVYKAPELKDEVEMRGWDNDSPVLWLRGQRCYPIIWYKREKKQQ